MVTFASSRALPNTDLSDLSSCKDPSSSLVKWVNEIAVNRESSVPAKYFKALKAVVVIMQLPLKRCTVVDLKLTALLRL